MIEPFMRQEIPGIGPEGFFIPVANPDASWFFEEPTVATREYKGELLRHTASGWQYWQPAQWHEVADNARVYIPASWQAVYPKVPYLRQILQVLGNTWRKRNSPYKYVQEFEDAESPFTDSYELGEYWLVKGDPWFLVPVNKAEQLDNVNSIDIHKIGGVAAVFEALQDALVPLRDNVYGVIFTASDGRRTRVRLTDFDWTKYDA